MGRSTPHSRPYERAMRLAGTSLLIAGAIVLAGVPATRADDRDLLRSSTGKPYVFFLMDTTGSTQGEPGDPSGGPYTPRNLDDDPTSKLYLEKEAVYRVVDESEGIHFGFASFPNRNRLYVDDLNACGGRCVNDQVCSSGDNNGCSGWEPNGDQDAARFRTRFLQSPVCDANGSNQVNIKWPTTTDSETGLEYGDVVPLNWNDDNVEVIKRRMAPNLAMGEEDPDFGIRRYFQSSDVPNTLARNVIHPQARPLIANGNTPLAAALQDFRNWHTQWRPTAETNDPDLAAGCRPVVVILLTDGAETCNGDPVQAAGAVFGAGVPVYVVGFGLRPEEQETLNDIAEEGGTCAVHDEAGVCLQHAFAPADGDELVEALSAIVQQVSTEAASFASISQSQQSVNDRQKFFFPSFTPASGSAYWPGSLDAFLQPVPLIADAGPDQGKPDTSVACSSERTSGCFLWNARDQTLQQVDSDDFLGPEPTQRRVFYSQYSKDPGAWVDLRRTLDPTSEETDTGVPSIRYDLWRGLGLFEDPGSVPDNGFEAEEDDLADRTAAIIDRTLQQKQVTIPTGGSVETIDFVVGDFFHSTPLVVANPPASRLFITDAGFDQSDDAAECENGADRGYRCFFNRHLLRRKVLLAGSNDGMLHAFDAGIFRPGETDPPSDDGFDEGTGHELWAYMPRTIMPTVTRLAEGIEQDWGVDGPPAAVDAMIDPAFGPSGPTPGEREWRTVVVGGLREGGRGYYALDVTQPDPLGDDFVPTVGAGDWVPGCLGQPLEAGSNPPTDCGPVRYPAPLWEFDDSESRPGNIITDDPPGGLPVLVDEDGNGEGDLGDTWSTPSLGRILVCKEIGNCNPDDESNVNPYDPDSSGGLEVKTVAIFGGGMDVDSKDDPTNANRGNWLYMVDVETGKPLYKRELAGAAPADVAAVDTDGDGFLDRVYVPTLAGKLYRIDLIPDPDGNLPMLELFEISTLECDATDATESCPQQLRIVDTDPDQTEIASWDPYIIFDASADGVNRPLYIRPTVFFVAGLRQYAVALGTGDREDLWSSDEVAGRFFVFADDRPLEADSEPPEPLTAANLIALEVGQTTFDDESETHDALLMPGGGGGRGWFFELDDDERVNQPAFALSGVLIFSTFIPAELTGEAICGVTGSSRVFGVNTVNASGLMGLGGPDEDPPQFVSIDDFVSNPFAEAGGISEGSEDEGSDDDGMPPNVQEVFDGLQALFPANCTFANYRVDVKMVASDTTLEWPASVPVCIVEKNWKEF